MRIALYGKKITDKFYEYLEDLMRKLTQMNCKVSMYKDLYEQMQTSLIKTTNVNIFKTHKDLKGQTDILLSIGGDGTLLDTILLVQDSGIPVMGINIGRLGFLSSIAKEKILPALEAIKNNEFTLEKRTLLKVDTQTKAFGKINYGLNEVCCQKKDTSSLINIHAYVDGILLNSYWADGLIVATPTGSTGYSLSCGGPIITPESENFIITPIATHNLTVRPIVIPDNTIVKLKFSGREEQYLVSLDARTVVVEKNEELIISKQNFTFNLISMKDDNFFMVIRNKLMWGFDKRN